MAVLCAVETAVARLDWSALAPMAQLAVAFTRHVDMASRPPRALLVDLVAVGVRVALKTRDRAGVDARAAATLRALARKPWVLCQCPKRAQLGLGPAVHDLGVLATCNGCLRLARELRNVPWCRTGALPTAVDPLDHSSDDDDDEEDEGYGHGDSD